MITSQQIMDSRWLDLESAGRFDTYLQIHKLLEECYDEPGKDLPATIWVETDRIKCFCEHVHKELEAAHARRFTDWRSFFQTMPSDRVLRTIEREEIQFGGIDHSGLVFMGAGPCPYSAITLSLISMTRGLGTRAAISECISSDQFGKARLLLSDAADGQWTGHSMNCVDSDRISCEMATEFLQKAKAKDSKVTHALGEEYLLAADERHVFIAAAAINKQKIIASVMQQLLRRPTDGIVVIRTVQHDSPLSIIYEPFEMRDLPADFSNHARVLSSSVSLPSSCYSSIRICVQASVGAIS